MLRLPFISYCYDAWLTLRDRCLTSSRFQRLAEDFPLTRPIARKRQRELFDIVSGFVYSQILLACVQLDVLSKVGTGVNVPMLSSRIGLGVDETRRLAEGAASLRLLQQRGSVFRLGDLGAALLANPGVLAMVQHHPNLYRDLTDPVAFLKAGRGDSHLSRFWAYARSDTPAEMASDDAHIYSRLMATSQDMIAREILCAYDFHEHKTLLDVGGGHGAFISAVAKQHPELNLQIFDLPPVISQARRALKEAGLESRAAFFSGSFFDDALPEGADLISLVRIIHDHDDGPAQAILNAAYKALPAGGSLILCEPMSTGGQAMRISQAYFNFYLYAMGSGRPRTLEEIKEMLQTAGFDLVQHVPTRFPLMTSIVRARKGDRKV